MSDDIPECPDPEFRRLAASIRNWRPEFGVGHYVMRAPGQLGATGARGKVIGFSWKGTHLCATVQFPDRTETFVANIYCRAALSKGDEK